MAKTAFVNDVLEDPTKFYRSPIDVLRDRRLTPDQRVTILEAWVAKDGESPSIGEALKEARDRMANED